MPSENNPFDSDTSESTDTQLNQVFTALKDPLRREILMDIAERNEDTLSVDSLCRTLDEDPRAFEGTEYEGWEVESLRTKLIQTHLPHLVDRKVVEYDARSEMIRMFG
ncbi:DUF7344 domain-containing protein [Haladaptatus caseinilyticus]|uniref:DUF7344 domain-containing protein n=1 Tax=Haladaptatus caseinilyticus TaxID=2993314 RepID=UPI00224AC7FD|nr:hypothetical protein [Haladaptatus caseinilyticus]